MKKIWWRLPIEIKEWEWAFLSSIPGHVGEFLRKLILTRHFKRCGKDLKMATHVTIQNPQKLEIGDGVFLMKDVFINAGGGVSIGDRSGVAAYSKIWSVNHRFDRTDIPIWEQGWRTAPVTIENDVWIGTNAIILPGVTLSKGSIIGAGSVITKDSPPYSIVVGNPGKVVGSRIPKEKDV